LSIRAQSTGRHYQSINASFTEPWLGGTKPNSFSVSFHGTKQSNGQKKWEDKEEGEINPGYRGLTTLGASVSYGIQLNVPDDYFTLNNTLQFQQFKDFGWVTPRLRQTSQTTNGSSTQQQLPVNYYDFSIKEKFSRNSIDAPIYPRTGSKFALTLELTPPYSLISDKLVQNNGQQGGLLEYHKWKFDAEWYENLVGDLVVKARASFGFLKRYNKSRPYSPFGRFEVGGDGISNYSLYDKEIVALRGYNPINPDITTRAQTGTVFDKFTLELRYPLTLERMSTIYGLAFLEGGNVWLNSKDYDPFDIRRSAGLGIRVYLPMFGLLGVDFGIPFDQVDARGQPRPPATNFGQWMQRGKFSFVLGFEPY
jgi:outer membrane protein insertion porin family